MARVKNKGEEQHNTPQVRWDQVGISPSVQLKFGIKRRVVPLERSETHKRGALQYGNRYIELKGRWDNSPGFGSLLTFRLKNVSSSSIRITRLVFPTENGLDDYIRDFDPAGLSFLRNGYQSWSTARSYRVTEKPLRPWLGLISLASSNMANLPSNTRGILSSEMFSIICDFHKDEDFLVGQAAPFNQFFYIRLNLYEKPSKMSYFELVYDFGRKMIGPGETIELDGIIMAKGRSTQLQSKYFSFIRQQMKLKLPRENRSGWCSWYYYFNKISPQIILDNLTQVRGRDLPFDVIQIDDGYQDRVGDWLRLRPEFEDKMPVLADAIRKAGYEPGLWLAPFVAEKGSDLVQTHPEYLLRNEYGKAIVAGYNVFWPGHWYYGLDATNPRFEEYIRHVIRTITKEWGFRYLKCDFLFGGCLRGGTHHDLTLSRAEVLRHGMRLIREEAGKGAFIVGCGMPLSAGIGLVEAMRVGPDTGPYWSKAGGRLLNTGAVVGVRNSIRNVMVRSGTHRKLWLLDPDCVMLRKRQTHLTAAERQSQINAIVVSGGLLLYSDDFTQLPEPAFDEMRAIDQHNRACSQGDAIAVDLMEQEIPEIFFNTAGYLAIFNTSERKKTKRIDLEDIPVEARGELKLTDVWNGQSIGVTPVAPLVLEHMQPHSSRLFRVVPYNTENPARRITHARS